MNTTTTKHNGRSPVGWVCFILILVILLLSVSGSFAQIAEKNNIVRTNTLSPAKVADALDVMKPFATSGTNTYTISPGVNTYTGALTYATGDIWTVTIGIANTSSTTSLNVNSEGAVALKDSEGNNFAIGDLKAGATYSFVYNSTGPVFKLIGAASGGGVGNTADTNELPKSDGTDLTPSKLFVTATGEAVTLETESSGTDQLTVHSNDLYLTSAASTNISSSAEVSVAGTTGVSINSSSGNITFNANGSFAVTSTTATLPSATSIGSVSNTELGYVNGVTSPIQDQFEGKQDLLTSSSVLAAELNDENGTGEVVFTSSLPPMEFACSDLTTALTAAIGTTKGYMAAHRTLTITGIFASVLTAQTAGSILTVDIKKNGTSILSTYITIDNSERTSFTAVTPAVLSTTALSAGDIITAEIRQCGTSPAGLIVGLFVK
jgi:hypothetical protein